MLNTPTDNTDSLELDQAILNQIAFVLLRSSFDDLGMNDQAKVLNIYSWHSIAVAADRDKAVQAARIEERQHIALDNYRGQTFSETTDWKGKFDKFIRNNEKRISQLQSDTPAGGEDE